MRKVAAGMTALCFAGLQGVTAETIITAQDYAVDSDVVLESAVREIKSIPKDTANVIGDTLKFVSDETVTATKGVAAVFKGNPVEKAEQTGMKEVGNAWYTENDIVFRSYSVSEGVGSELAQGAEGETIDVSGAFTGMEFPKGASAYYRPEFKKLFVRQTMENILLIEDTLAEQHNATRELMGKQVEIETKFVEVNQSTLNELGFDWNFDRKNGGDANIFENLVFPYNQSILSDTLRTSAQALNSGATPAALAVTKGAGSLRWSLLISALEQSDDTDVLSAPRIVTRDGNTATIQVGEERMVPKRFGVNSANTSIYVEHSDWDSELMGVQLEVTPELRSGDLIDLELKPKVMELVGYDDYQVSPDNAVMWPIQGTAYQNAMQIGRYPIATGYISDTGAFITNSVAKLYQSILNATTFLGLAYQGSSSTLTTTNAPDLNDWSVQRNNGNSAAATYGFQDNRRMWDKEELIAVPSLHGSLPYFRIREMESQVTVADGSTVGMGGLIYDKLETYKDKVPVLGSLPIIGRLFRSEGEKTTKRNLMIFVTATQVDVNGRRASDLALLK